MTGRRPDTLKVWDLRTHFRQTLPEVVTLPQHFKRQGYIAVGIGKLFHNESGGKPPFPFADPVSWSEPPTFAYGAHWQDWVVPGDPSGPKVKGEAVQCLDVPDDSYFDGRIATAACARLRELAGSRQPFFLAVGLERLDLARNTIVVFWSDHGFHLGEHNLWAKTTNYELDTRVPLVIAAPGVTKDGTRTTALVELLDLYPTLAELSGLPAATGLEGKSLLPILREPKCPGKPMVVSQHPHPSYGKATHMGYTLRTSTHRYVEWRDLLGGGNPGAHAISFSSPRPRGSSRVNRPRVHFGTGRAAECDSGSRRRHGARRHCGV
jgi:arylsulfatase A-like enzyme